MKLHNSELAAPPEKPKAMSVKVKICGLKTARALDVALEAGTDYFGLVFYEPSPRNVGHETAAMLADRGRGQAQSVALLVNPDSAALQRVLDQVTPDLIQLHGDEPPERVREIRAIANRPVIKAVKVETSSDVETARAYEECADLILYDSKAPDGKVDALPGGNGMPFDWQALMSVKRSNSFMLSGGLNPDNVAAAIAETNAPIVDVSSGVESAPGVKDDALIRRFIEIAKSASHPETSHEPENA